MRMVLDVDGVVGGRRGALLSPGWEDVYMDVDGEARCCRLVEDFFYFLLAAGWGLHV